jgi:predicted MFS family arabinose efflux permease
MSQETPAIASISPGNWIVWSVGVLFYVEDFLIRVSPSVMVGELMRDFGMTAAGLGGLSAWYLYAYGIAQVPVGLVLDRFGPRRLLSGAALATAVGCALFALAPGIGVARFGRLLSGLGGAASFLGSLKLAQLLLPADRYAVIAGGTMGIGIFAAMLLQPSLAVLVQHVGWRPGMADLSAAGLMVAGILWLLVPGSRAARQDRAQATGSVLRRALFSPQVWMLALVDTAMAGPMLAWGGLWSVPYVMQSHSLTRTAAVEVTAVLLVGWGFGGPLVGWISDWLGCRKGPLAGSVAAACALWLTLALLPRLPLAALILIYAAIGLASGGMLVGFALARDLSPASAATAGGVMNTLMTLAGAGLQPLIGWILDLRWQGAMAAGVRLYPAAAYGDAVLVFVGLQAAAFAVATRLDEGRRNSG